MSDVVIVSTTDSPEAVLAAQGRAVEPKESKAETKPAAEEIPAETLEASEASDENETDDEDSSDESKEPKKAKGLVKRIGKLTKQREDARREVDYWKAEALKQKPQESKPIEAPVKADSTGKPTAESFGTHEEYVEALADWKVDQKLSARDATQKQNELKNEQTKREQGYFKEVAEFIKIKPDYEDVVGAQKLSSLTIYESVLDAGKDGPELLYELAKDPEEYERIRTLPAIAAAREIGKIQARLAKESSETKTIETKTTKAPKPPSPVGSGKAYSTKDPSDMDFDEFKAWRQPQLRRG